MSEHTPGPWAVGYYKSTKGNDVYLHSEHLAVWPEKGKNEQTEQTPICLITPTKKETATDQANARLIAEAPKLNDRVAELEAQRDALVDACGAALEKCPFPVGAVAVKAQLEAAISKAGEPA